MGLGVSLFLIAVGAVLAWAVDVQTEGIDLNTVGVILMVVGLAGLVLSLVFWGSWGGWSAVRRREVVYDERDAMAAPSTTRRRRVIQQDEEV
jgi:hypothetical protein